MKKLSTNKGLRVAVAGVALVAAGSLALPLAGAAKGGTKGQNSGGGTTLVDSPYGISADGGAVGGFSVISATDKSTGQPLASLNESVGYKGTCTQNGSLVGFWSTGLVTTPSVSIPNKSATWTSGAAVCTAELVVVRNGVAGTTASITYNVAG
ncbi:MAG: hypothetical protein ACKO2C_05915 [Actinomycetes bacterium]